VLIDLPETSEAELAVQAQVAASQGGAYDRSQEPFWKQYRALFGFWAQFIYIGFVRFSLLVVVSC